MLWEISLLIRFQVSTILKLSAPLGNSSKHQIQHPWSKSSYGNTPNKSFTLLLSVSQLSLLQKVAPPMFKWNWQVIELGKAATCCHQFFPKPASSAEERWLSISIASLLYSDQGCDDMMAVVGWVGFGCWEWSGAVVMLAISFVATLHHGGYWCVCKSFAGIHEFMNPQNN